MADNLERQIITKLIKSNDYITSKDLAFSLNVSEKTILKYLNNIKTDLEANGAELVVKHGYGSILKVDNQEKFNKYIAEISSNEIPSSKHERNIYVLSKLLNTDDYINIYDLADELYVSPSLLRIIIKDLINLVKSYNLQLDHSKNHGYRIIGNEEDIRRCLSKECNGTDNISNLNILRDFKEDITAQITSIVAKTLEQYHIAVSSDAVESLALHILIAINRNETNNYIDVDESIIRKLQSSPELYVIRNISKQLKEKYNIELPEVELGYLTLHLNGKQRLIAHEHLQVKIDNDALVFYNKFLRNIYQTYLYDFFDDNELRISLLNHIVPFINRANNNNQITKSSLTGIKNEFPFAYELALSGLSFITEDNLTIEPAEIGYFALHLALSLEKNKSNHRAYNFAIITSEVNSLYNIMHYRLSTYLNNPLLTVKFFNINEARSLNEEHSINYDLILNTTNELFPFKNILNISTFLSDYELEQIATYLKKSNQFDYLYNLFNKDTYIQLNTPVSKEEIIKSIIKQASKQYDLSDDLYQRVLDRENIESTEYGNYIAIPHALKQDNKEQWISVCKLDKPTTWNKQKIQLVFLMNIHDHDKVAWFMQKISKALAKESISKSLIEADTFDKFIEEFKKI